MTTPINRDRILASLHGEIPDAVGVAEQNFWPDTMLRWRGEGLPDGADPGEYFGVDSLRRSVVPDLSLQLEPRLVREDDNVILKADANGVTHMAKKGSYTPPSEVDFTVRGREDWARFRAGLVPGRQRLQPDFRERYEADRAAHSVLLYKNPDPCWAVFKVLGYEGTLVQIAQDPELLCDMFAVYTDLIIGMYELLAGEGLRFDVAWFNADICYRGGMIFSPRFYRRAILPHIQRLTAYFAARGMPTIYHTCGNVRQLVPLYLEAGVRGLHPLEARAGNDIRELRQLYGDRMVFIGNISADALSGGADDVRREIAAKLPAAKEGGAYVFHSDHSIPPTVSLANYRYALQLAEEYGRIRQG